MLATAVVATVSAARVTCAHLLHYETEISLDPICYTHGHALYSNACVKLCYQRNHLSNTVKHRSTDSNIMNQRFYLSCMCKGESKISSS